MQKTKTIPKAVAKEMEPFIKRRLELKGGSTLRELAADLVNRFHEIAAENERMKLYGDLNATAERHTDEAGNIVSRKGEIAAMRKRLAELTEEARNAREGAIAMFAKIVGEWLVETYGKPRFDAQGFLIGYGTSIRVNEDQHAILIAGELNFQDAVAAK